jgi:excisionase family DNA binding protein
MSSAVSITFDAPLVASPKQAMKAIQVSRKKLYELINTGELESYTEGKSRRITVKSINDYIETLFFGLDDARTKIAAWVADYNAERPHSSLKYLTPAAYAATFTATDDRLRNPDQLRRSPVAQPTPQGVQNAETLIAAG